MKENSTIADYLDDLKCSRKFGPQLVCQKIIDPVEPELVDPAGVISPDILAGLNEIGISRLYQHQTEALQALRAGSDIVVATPTASGKSLIYNIPVLQRYLERPDSRSLYLFPLKALAQDQHLALEKLKDVAGISADGANGGFSAIYDGDTPTRARAALRKKSPPVLITNPDMLHLSLLPYHDSWSEFFRNLHFVVLDEIHTYRGLFGSHVAWVLRRLQRVCERYGARPQFIMLSATIGNPADLAGKLIGRDPKAICRSGAPSPRKHFLFLNPWDSAAHTAAQLLEKSLKQGLRTIVYTKSRRMTELITMWTKPRLGKLEKKLSSYRAGFLPEQRRSIEQSLASGGLLGVISTSALELGIDIGDLDLCILVGYPGSVMATWQRSGRVGRGGKESATIFIAAEDALDQHFMRNPEDFFARSAEKGALNPLNSTISRQHLHCSAAEIPLDQQEKLLQKNPPLLTEIHYLAEHSVLHEDRSGGLWYSSRKRPHLQVSLRGGGSQFQIIHSLSGEVIGEIDGGRALKETHPGAIYIHQSQTLEVVALELLGHEVIVKDSKPKYYTRPTVNKHTEILQRITSKAVRGCMVSWGNVRVTEKVTGYQRVNNFTQKVISNHPLELPEQVIETEGLWLDIPACFRSGIEKKKMHFMGAIHALEHGMIAMYPLHILCDRNDIGGISCPHHEQTGVASIFIYDGYAGGAGLAREAYGLIEDLLVQTEKSIRSCGCELGCPSCVHSPKCGSGNRPIDKEACLELLQTILVDNGAAVKSMFQVAVNDIAARESAGSKDPVVASGAGSEGQMEEIVTLPQHYCVFDLETQRSAQEVGGWGRAARMGMSVGVVYDSLTDDFITYLEDEVDELVEHLQRAEMVVGFNIKRFDYQVLSGYTSQNLQLLPTVDILDEIYTRLGYRLSLGRLAEETLGYAKSADGLQALEWYRENRIREIVEYCKKDVEITKELFLFGFESGYLLYRNKSGATVRVNPGLDRAVSLVQQKTGGRSGPE